MKKAGVPYFPIYNLRHAIPARGSVGLRQTRWYSGRCGIAVGMVDEVREGIERANEHAYQNQKLLRFYYGRVKPEKEVWKTSVSG